MAKKKSSQKVTRGGVEHEPGERGVSHEPGADVDGETTETGRGCLKN